MRLPQLFLAFVACLPFFVGEALATDASAYAGRFEVADPAAKEAAIESAVEQGAQQFAALIRPIVRSTLRKAVKVVDWFVFEPTDNKITIRTDSNAEGWSTDLSGTPVEVTNDKGDPVSLKRWIEAGQLKAQGCSDMGCSDFYFELSADRNSMTMHIVTSSKRLDEPLRYAIEYVRK
ncbi:MAG: hypothetical protein KDA24_13285 [Deltaproteobacteria bacterium]|nr:hypothetical protein [Deltaproteobacteria bacterium]